MRVVHMSQTSTEALDKLETAALNVLERANATLSGASCACFEHAIQQFEAIHKARAKVDAAIAIVNAVAYFRTKYGDFN